MSLTFKDFHINWYSSLPGQYEDLWSVQFQLFPLDLYAVIMYCLYFVLISHYCYYLLPVFTIGNISISFILNFLVVFSLPSGIILLLSKEYHLMLSLLLSCC